MVDRQQHIAMNSEQTSEQGSTGMDLSVNEASSGECIEQLSNGCYVRSVGQQR
jgi:hypothetical protein